MTDARYILRGGIIKDKGGKKEPVKLRIVSTKAGQTNGVRKTQSKRKENEKGEEEVGEEEEEEERVDDHPYGFYLKEPGPGPNGGDGGSAGFGSFFSARLSRDHDPSVSRSGSGVSRGLRRDQITKALLACRPCVL